MYCKVHSAKGLPNFNLKVCTYVSGKQLVYWVQSINQIDIYAFYTVYNILQKN